MARILFVWEFGGGWGHLSRICPLAEGLHARGHQVSLVVRDPKGAEPLFANLPVPRLKIPAGHRTPKQRYEPPSTYPHILHNLGFGNPEQMATRISRWRRMFDEMQPDLVIYDHSPTAILAARGMGMKQIAIGTGFCCPPDLSPIPNLRPQKSMPSQQIYADEQRLVQALNSALGDPLLNIDRVGQLFREMDAVVLTTFREIDHYPNRPGGNYWGPFSRMPGEPVTWPTGNGPRVFAYLKPFPSLPVLLGHLRDARVPAIVYVPKMPKEAQQQFATEQLRFLDKPADMVQAAGGCDVALLNGNHGSTAVMLVAGKPIMQFPLCLEQQILAMTVERLGCGLCCSVRRPNDFGPKLTSLLREPRFAESAKQFADRHPKHTPAVQVSRFVQLCEGIAASRAKADVTN